MFAKTAAFYDRVYAALGKDYASEADALCACIRERAPGARTLLDAGCGTGAHLALFEAQGFACRGFDLDLNMVALARARCPDMPIEPGDFASFVTPERFDVVTCLFAAIAYTRTSERLGAAIANLAAALAPGGQLFVDPFVAPGDYVAGRLNAVYVDDPDLKLARMSISKRIGKIALIDFHYMIATGRGGIEREFERHEVGLFEPAEYERAIRAAGLTFEALDVEPFPRGLYRGIRAGPSAPDPGGR